MATEEAIRNALEERDREWERALRDAFPMEDPPFTPKDVPLWQHRLLDRLVPDAGC